MRCISCKSEIDSCYYHVSGAVTCPTCAQRRIAKQQPVGRLASLQSAVLGIVAAAVGGFAAAWLFAHVTIVNRLSGGLMFAAAESPAVLWGAQIGAVLLIGILVVTAMLLPTHGRSNRAIQVIAVVAAACAFILSHLTLAHSYASALASIGDTEHLLGLGSGPPSILALLADALVVPWRLAVTDPLNLPNLLVPFAVLFPAVWNGSAADDTLIMGPYSSSAESGEVKPSGDSRL